MDRIFVVNKSRFCKSVFLFLKICQYGHQKIRFFKQISTEKPVLQNNKKQGKKLTLFVPIFFTLMLLDRTFSNIFTNRLLRWIRLCKTDLLISISTYLKRIKKSLLWPVYRPFPAPKEHAGQGQAKFQVILGWIGFSIFLFFYFSSWEFVWLNSGLFVTETISREN